MVMNVHLVTSAMRRQSAVNHFTVDKLLLMPIVLVHKLVRMVWTRLARRMSFVLHRRPVPIQSILPTRTSWMWDLSTAGKIIRMHRHLVHLPARVDLVLNVPSLAPSILVMPILRVMIQTLTSAVRHGTMLHQTVSFHAKVVWIVNVLTRPSASPTLRVATMTHSCVEPALKMLLLA